MIRTGKHKQLAVALNLQKFYFGFKTIVQSFSSMASSNPSLWISKPYEMIRFLHTYGHYHNLRVVELFLLSILSDIAYRFHSFIAQNSSPTNHLAM